MALTFFSHLSRQPDIKQRGNYYFHISSRDWRRNCLSAYPAASRLSGCQTMTAERAWPAPHQATPAGTNHYPQRPAVQPTPGQPSLQLRAVSEYPGHG